MGQYKKFRIGSREYKILKSNLAAIEKVEERTLRRREESTSENYKGHLLDFFGRVNSDIPYRQVTLDHIDKFWRWKKEENEKRKKGRGGHGVGRTTEKFSKHYVNLITSVLTTFFTVNECLEFADQLKAQERLTVYWVPKKLDAAMVRKLWEEQTVREGYRLMGQKKTSEFSVRRDMLLIELLTSTGIRISEAQNLKRDDTRTNVKEPFVAIIRAKRGHTRKVRVSERFIELYDGFMALRKDKNASIFTNKSGGALTVGTLKTLFRQATAPLSKPDAYGKRKTFGPHMLRHYYATICVEIYPLSLCRQNLGHVSIDMTGKYIDETKEQLSHKSPIDARRRK